MVLSRLHSSRRPGGGVSFIQPSLRCTLIEEAISISQEGLQKGDDDELYTLKEETKGDETICMEESVH